MCRTRVARLAQLAAGGTFLWCTLDALCNTPMGDAAARAILACEAYVKPGHMLADFQADASAAPLAFRIGAVAATTVAFCRALCSNTSQALQPGEPSPSRVVRTSVSSTP